MPVGFSESRETSRSLLEIEDITLNETWVMLIVDVLRVRDLDNPPVTEKVKLSLVNEPPAVPVPALFVPAAAVLPAEVVKLCMLDVLQLPWASQELTEK